ncbi:hypothetical protein PF007_g27962 [Phytophthora fragariae]|uniref:Uncharacterized protein n=1 Tax=Phytophthora fragariae TaxID=53985 RepID=A0A6A3Q2Z2_9STRA|nr:hypothetical protein PF007_g27962 [Phytophthora fragariae]
MQATRGAEPPDPGRDDGDSGRGLDCFPVGSPSSGAGIPPRTGARSIQNTPTTPEPASDAVTAPSSPAPNDCLETDGPWTGNSAAVLGTNRPLTEAQARASRVVTGIWNPLDKKHLVNTMLCDWKTTTCKEWNADEKLLREVALAPSEVKRGEKIRAMTAEESRALLAYIRGDLELPHPPNFIKSTMPPHQRAMLEDIHETYFNATLTANLPPQVNLRHNANIPHVTIFKELYNSNTDGSIGQEMMRCLQRDVKRLTP